MEKEKKNHGHIRHSRLCFEKRYLFSRNLIRRGTRIV